MMKKVTKKLLVGLMAVAMMSMVLVGCGSVQKQVDGDWTTSTINGKSVEEYAAEVGTNAAGAASNLSIKDGKATVSNSAMTMNYDVEYKSDRAEVKQDGNVVLTLTYNKDADTLSYKVDVNGTTNEYVMKKGTTDLSGAAAPEQGGAEEGAAEGGAEEGAAEGGAEEGGAEEGGAEGGEEAAE